MKYVEGLGENEKEREREREKAGKVKRRDCDWVANANNQQKKTTTTEHLKNCMFSCVDFEIALLDVNQD
jgi:hypothetical protein